LLLVNCKQQEKGKTLLVTIFHRTDRDRFYEMKHTIAAGGAPTYERAYSYEIEDAPEINMSILERIWRENNAVSGWEVNVKLNKRSLSVGDVVLVKGEGWEAQSIGFARLTDTSILHPHGLTLVHDEG
jgi:hypothetical protein